MSLLESLLVIREIELEIAIILINDNWRINHFGQQNNVNVQ